MVMSNYFFLVVNTFPKLHADNLFGWALSPSKIALVLASVGKHIISHGVETIFKKIFTKIVFNGKIVILRIL